MMGKIKRAMVTKMIFLFIALHKCSAISEGSGSDVDICAEMYKNGDIPQELYAAMCSELMSIATATVDVAEVSFISPSPTAKSDLMESSLVDFNSSSVPIVVSNIQLINEGSISIQEISSGFLEINLPTANFDEESDIFSPSLSDSFTSSNGFEAIVSMSNALSSDIPVILAITSTSSQLPTQLLLFTDMEDIVSPTHTFSLDEDFSIPTSVLFDDSTMTNLQSISTTFTSPIAPFSTYSSLFLSSEPKSILSSVDSGSNAILSTKIDQFISIDESSQFATSQLHVVQFYTTSSFDVNNLSDDELFTGDILQSETPLTMISSSNVEEIVEVRTSEVRASVLDPSPTVVFTEMFPQFSVEESIPSTIIPNMISPDQFSTAAELFTEDISNSITFSSEIIPSSVTDSSQELPATSEHFSTLKEVFTGSSLGVSFTSIEELLSSSFLTSFVESTSVIDTATPIIFSSTVEIFTTILELVNSSSTTKFFSTVSSVPSPSPDDVASISTTDLLLTTPLTQVVIGDLASFSQTMSLPSFTSDLFSRFLTPTLSILDTSSTDMGSDVSSFGSLSTSSSTLADFIHTSLLTSFPGGLSPSFLAPSFNSTVLLSSRAEPSFPITTLLSSSSSFISKRMTFTGTLSQIPSSLSVTTLASISVTSTSSSTVSTSVVALLQSSLLRMLIQINVSQYEPLLSITSQARRDLELAIVDAYIDALRDIGANKKKRLVATTVAKITTVGSRDADTGEVSVDFYIVAGSSPVEGSLVVAVFKRNIPPLIGGYMVIDIFLPGNEEQTTSIPNTVIIPVSAVGGLLVILVVCLIISLIAVIGVSWIKKRKQNDSIETVSIDVEAFSYHQKESIAIQHGTPTIEKLVRRTRNASDPRRSSTLALLASSSSGQTDAWQNNQLGNEPEETPAGLFQKITHYSDFQPMPSARAFKLRFHSSAVAPSPSTSNQSKTSLGSDGIKSTEAIIPRSPKTKFRERVRLHSRKVSSRGKQREQIPNEQETIVIPNKSTGGRDSEGDGGLGDVEPSSHSDGGEEKSPPHTTRPSTRRRNARRKLNSRGLAVTTDGYDTTDHKSHVPQSRQSRKHRQGKSMRSRPSTQSHISTARRTEYDTRGELAWMSTGNGVQLISIQPIEQMARGPSSSQIQRASWQALPQLPPSVPNQTYSREQLEQLLKIHKELEKVEEGLHHQRSIVESSADSLPRVKDNLDSSSSNFSAELASQAFKVSAKPVPLIPDQQHFFNSRHQFGAPLQPPPPQMGQLLWTPHGQSGSHPFQTQPLSPYQLSQLRNTQNTSALYPPTPLYPPTHFHHPFGASNK